MANFSILLIPQKNYFKDETQKKMNGSHLSWYRLKKKYHVNAKKSKMKQATKI